MNYLLIPKQTDGQITHMHALVAVRRKVFAFVWKRMKNYKINVCICRFLHALSYSVVKEIYNSLSNLCWIPS